MIDYALYKVLHVVAALGLVGGILSLLLVPARLDARRERLVTLWVTGCAAAIVLVAGFGLHARLGGIWQGWVVVKIVMWLILIGVMTHFRRKTPGSPVLAWLISFPAAAVAVFMAVYKPF
jgi:uncharacterized membrane protein